MSKGLSDYLMEQVLNHIYGAGTFSKPTGLTVHLYTSDPGPDDSGTEVNTTTEDTAYAAQSISFSAAATDGSDAWKIANSAQVTFPAVVYGTDGTPYTVTHAAVKDGSDNLLDYGPIPNISRETGKTLVLPVGQIFTRLSRTP